MNITSIQKYNSINFHAIQLSAEEVKKAEKHMDKLVNLSTAPLESITNSGKKVSQNALFRIFDKHLQEEATIKAGSSRFYMEVLSEIYLNFSELLYDIKNNPTLDKITDLLNKYKPSNDTFKVAYNYDSLDTCVFQDNPYLTKANLLTEKDLPKPKSAVTMEKNKDTLQSIIEKANLPPISEQRFQKHANGIKNSNIALEEQVNERTVYTSIRKCLLKLQLKNNNLPQDVMDKVKILSDILKCNEEEVIKIILRHTDILFRKPESIKQNITEAAKLFNCSEEEYIKAVLRESSLLGMKPENILKNITKTANFFNYDLNKLIHTALKKHPAVLYLKIETIAKNSEESLKILGCTENEFIAAGFKEPTLFYIKPETLKNNIQKNSELLNCPKECFIKIAMRQPKLFYYKPETLKNNIDKSSEILGSSTEDFVNAAVKSSSLLYTKQETLRNNIKNSAKLLEISEAEFIQMALRQPSLFGQKPETLRKKAEEMAKAMNLSVGEYVKLVSKHPTVLCQKPETLKRKVRITNYFQKVKGEPAQNFILQNSDDILYMRILAYLLQQLKDKELEKFVKIKRKFNFEEFLKANSDKHFSFTIPTDDIAKDFVKYVHETSEKTIGKTIFRFTITEPEQYEHK